MPPCFAPASWTKRWRRHRPRCARRRPISTRACCWASCWRSPATSNAPTWCSTPPPRSIRPRRWSWRNSASSSAPTWRGGSCSATAGCPSSSAIRPKRNGCSLAALVAMRAGDLAEAARQAEAAEAARPHASGKHGDAAFDDLRDADDLLAGSFEVLTTTGKYFWIPTERVQTLEFHAPKRPRDLLWRRASMSVADGPDGEVYLPAIYVADDPLTEALRLGRETDWRETEGGPVRGVGQRLLIVGEDAVPMMDLGNFPVRRRVSGRAGQSRSPRARPVAAARSADRRRSGPAARSGGVGGRLHGGAAQCGAPRSRGAAERQAALAVVASPHDAARHLADRLRHSRLCLGRVQRSRSGARNCGRRSKRRSAASSRASCRSACTWSMPRTGWRRRCACASRRCCTPSRRPSR